MILFWFITAIIFLIAELLTFTFGFIFITVGAVVITLLLGIDIISSTDFIYQVLIMLFFCVLSFLFFYRSFKKSKEDKISNFKEDMMAIVVEDSLIAGKEGKIKWSGTICNAMIDEESGLDKIEVGSSVVIEKFLGNIAIVKNVVNYK
ncbi:MAG: NfeD family protein [Rickettsiales bacterium]|nr:NfeD family protein [Rickettsiales bacterium]